MTSGRTGGFLIFPGLSIPGNVKLWQSPGRAGGLAIGNKVFSRVQPSLSTFTPFYFTDFGGENNIFSFRGRGILGFRKRPAKSLNHGQCPFLILPSSNPWRNCFGVLSQINIHVVSGKVSCLFRGIPSNDSDLPLSAIPLGNL